MRGISINDLQNNLIISLISPLWVYNVLQFLKWGFYVQHALSLFFVKSLNSIKNLRPHNLHPWDLRVLLRGTTSRDLNDAYRRKQSFTHPKNKALQRLPWWTEFWEWQERVDILHSKFLMSPWHYEFFFQETYLLRVV